MKKQWIGAAVLCIGLLLATGCSQKSSNESAALGYPQTTQAMTMAGNGIFAEENYGETADIYTGKSEAGNAALTGDSGTDVIVNDSARKLIRKADLSVETLEYEMFMERIQSTIRDFGGYIEEMVNNNKTYGNYDPYSYRTASITARIPADSLDAFLDMVGGLGNITREYQSAQDITMSYIDAEGRKKTLEIEQERLLALLEKAEKIEDIIALEERLSSVRYELESYASQLRTYDNLVDYSTVSLTIQEVREITKEDPQTLGERMGRGFSDTIFEITEGAKDIAVWFVTNLLYLVFWVAVIAAAVIVLRRVLKKRRGSRPKKGSNAKRTTDNDEKRTADDIEKRTPEE